MLARRAGSSTPRRSAPQRRRRRNMRTRPTWARRGVLAAETSASATRSQVDDLVGVHRGLLEPHALELPPGAITKARFEAMIAGGDEEVGGEDAVRQRLPRPRVRRFGQDAGEVDELGQR